MIDAKKVVFGGLLAITALLAWGFLAFPGGALADPPPHSHGGGGEDPGDPLAGTVYFRLCCGEVQIHSMAPDGSNKMALPGNVLGDWVAFDASHGLHGGRRWFLSVRNIPGGFYPYDP